MVSGLHTGCSRSWKQLLWGKCPDGGTGAAVSLQCACRAHLVSSGSPFPFPSNRVGECRRVSARWLLAVRLLLASRPVPMASGSSSVTCPLTALPACKLRCLRSILLCSERFACCGHDCVVRCVTCDSPPRRSLCSPLCRDSSLCRSRVLHFNKVSFFVCGSRQEFCSSTF